MNLIVQQKGHVTKYLVADLRMVDSETMAVLVRGLPNDISRCYTKDPTYFKE